MKKAVILSVIIFVAIAQTASIALHSNGIAGYNNSPGEITCTSCHVTYPLNSPGGNVIINISGCSNNNYIAGQTYTVNVKISRAGTYLFGFSFEALDSTGANAGILTLINSSTTTLSSALVNSNNRTNITHYGGVFNNDSCTFSFKWTAPVTNVGNITFYAAANASNGDGYAGGDYIYTASQILNPNISLHVLNNKELASRIYIYPNPTSNQFFIETNTNDKLSMDMFDATGKRILSQIIYGKTTMDARSLPDGIYTISIMGNDGVINKRLVIVR